MREVCCDGSTFKVNERHGNVLDCLEIRKKTKHNWRVSTFWRPEKNLQDGFHILAYRDLSCHRLPFGSCVFLILASLLERNKKLVRFLDKIRQKVWCPA